jgi:hypothetical protein
MQHGCHLTWSHFQFVLWNLCPRRLENNRRPHVHKSIYKFFFYHKNTTSATTKSNLRNVSRRKFCKKRVHSRFHPLQITKSQLPSSVVVCKNSLHDNKYDISSFQANTSSLFKSSKRSDHANVYPRLGGSPPSLHNFINTRHGPQVTWYSAPSKGALNSTPLLLKFMVVRQNRQSLGWSTIISGWPQVAYTEQPPQVFIMRVKTVTMIKILYGRSDKLSRSADTSTPRIYVTLNERNTVLNASSFHDPLHNRLSFALSIFRDWPSGASLGL